MEFLPIDAKNLLPNEFLIHGLWSQSHLTTNISSPLKKKKMIGYISPVFLEVNSPLRSANICFLLDGALLLFTGSHSHNFLTVGMICR